MVAEPCDSTRTQKSIAASGSPATYYARRPGRSVPRRQRDQHLKTEIAGIRKAHPRQRFPGIELFGSGRKGSAYSRVATLDGECISPVQRGVRSERYEL